MSREKLVRKMEEKQDQHKQATGRFMGPDQLVDRTWEVARQMGLDVEPETVESVADEVYV